MSKRTAFAAVLAAATLALTACGSDEPSDAETTAGGSGASAEAGVLRVGTEGTYSPFSFHDTATGELTGTPSIANGKTTYRYVQGDVHDFAWTADKRSAKPLERTWTYPGGDPVKVRVLFPPEYADNAPVVMKATIDSLKYFSDTLGRYPYRTVTAVIPPYNAGEAGGMEYPTFFTADSVSNFKPGGFEQYMLDFVTIHEFGHGYFYGILASNEFEEPMLDEGVNQY